MRAPPRRSRRHPSPARCGSDHAPARRDPHRAGGHGSTVGGHTESNGAHRAEIRDSLTQRRCLHRAIVTIRRRSTDKRGNRHQGRSRRTDIPNAQGRASLVGICQGAHTGPAPLTNRNPRVAGLSCRSAPSLHERLGRRIDDRERSRAASAFAGIPSMRIEGITTPRSCTYVPWPRSETAPLLTKPQQSATNTSGRPDLNRGPHRPERCALPGCATPRMNPVCHSRGRPRGLKAPGAFRMPSAAGRRRPCRPPAWSARRPG